MALKLQSACACVALDDLDGVPLEKCVLVVVIRTHSTV